MLYSAPRVQGPRLMVTFLLQHDLDLSDRFVLLTGGEKAWPLEVLWVNAESGSRHICSHSTGKELSQGPTQSQGRLGTTVPGWASMCPRVTPLLWKKMDSRDTSQ